MTNKTLPLPEYLPIPTAARQFGLTSSALKKLVESGRVKAIKIDGEMAVSKDAVETALQADVPKEQLPVYKKYTHLKGKRIGIAEAGRKYGIPYRTIGRWVDRGLIARFGHAPDHATKILIDEADVAYCTEIYKAHNGRSGRWIFNPDGTPYIPKAAAA